MKILSLELYLYKRFSLNNTSYFKITLLDQLQLIVGTNGSGKSSLLYALSPLPANASDYAKEGYKYIEISHNNHTYSLRSTFSPKQSHSFIIDGRDELNKGGTASVQKELVQKHFGITANIHELLIGNSKFTNMSPAERRSWFTLMSDVNYDYAISVYQKLKERHRDTQGAIKVLNNRIVQESTKALSELDIMRLNENVVDINNVLSYLLDQRPNVASNLMVARTALTTNTDAIITSNVDIITLIKSLRKLTRDVDVNDLDTDTIDKQSQLLSYSSRLESLMHIATTKHQLAKNIQSSQVDDISRLDEDILKLEADIIHARSNIKTDLLFSDATSALSELANLLPDLTDIFSVIPMNADKSICRASHADLFNKINNDKNQLQALQSKVNKVYLEVQKQEHLLTHNETICPNCEYKWSRGYTATDHANLTKLHAATVTEIEQITLVISNDTARLGDMKDYFDLYSRYNNITKITTALRPLWDRLLASDIILVDPKSIPSILGGLYEDIKTMVYIDTLITQQSELNHIVSITKGNGVKSLTDLINDIQDTELEINDTKEKIDTLKNKVLLNNTTKEMLSRLQNQSNLLRDLLNTQNKLKEDNIDILKREAINALITDLNIKRSTIEHMVSASQIQIGVVATLNANLADLVIQEANLRLLVDGLSPVDGLIAQGMTGFINAYIGKMNKFISSVWQYPLVIQPCSMPDDKVIELDYKFPLSANGNTAVADVALGSTAMQDIIDLAFKLVAAHYLGLATYPVYLDELGKTFDLVHRQAVTSVISNITSTSDIEQVFMVSHYSDSYGSLKNSATTVLCPANIVIPKDAIVNQHVAMN